MTCIIAYKNKKGNVVLAGDKIASDSYTSLIVKEPKVFKNGDFMLGYTTSFRMGQILNHLWAPPQRKIGQNTVNYLYSDVVPSLIKVFDDNRYGKDNHYGNFIMVYENRIYEVQEEMSLLEKESNIIAVGSGEYHAIGAVEVLLDYVKSDKSILEKAFAVVAKNVVSVSKEFDFITNEEE